MKTSVIILVILLGCVSSLSSQQTQSPIEIMSDITNDFGVCVLQLLATPQANAVVSPYGLVSVALLLYEGANGVSAAEFPNTLHLPWHRDITRIGFRDLHNYLKNYFTSDGFLRGLILNKSNITLRAEYISILQFYGFQPDAPFTQPATNTTEAASNTTTTTTSTTPVTTTTTSTTPATTTTSTTPATTTTSTTPATTTTSTTPATTTTSTTPATTTTSTTPATTTTSTTPATTTTSTTPATTTTSTTPATTTTTSTTPETTTTTSTTPATTSTTSTTQATSQADDPTRELKEMTSDNVTLPIIGTTQVVSPENTDPATENMVTTISAITTIGKNSSITGGTSGQTTISEGSSEKGTTISGDTSGLTTLITGVTNVQSNTILSSTSGPTTVTSVTVTSDVTDTTLSDNTVLSNGIATNEGLFKPSSRIVSFTSSDVQSTQYFSPTTIDNFQQMNAGSTLTEADLLTEPFVSTVDSTGPFTISSNLDDVLIVSTPADSILPLREMSMLDALMSSVNRETDFEPLSTNSFNSLSSTEGNMVIKRSTVDDSIKDVNTNTINSKGTSLSESVQDQTVLSETTSSTTVLPEDWMLVETFTSKQEAENEVNQGTPGGVDKDVNSQSVPNSPQENVADSSLLAILSDSITFPNKSRQKRSIYGYNRNIQFGNWITQSRQAPWFQTAGEQWFSTFFDKKLVPMLTYSAYLPFSYISAIGASALELPLDDVRYSLVILLPNQNNGLRNMLTSLANCPIRYIVTHLKYTPIYAVVPVFTIVKHVNLTPALQLLGIRKVFDAFQANLTNMSDEPNLYVRSVEQVITVSVRKYYNTSKWINAAPSQIEKHFLATRPFAFFVVDSLSKVSLLAGTIVDPLL